ncbi:hypothetical protein CRUP_035651, partial [Coryphaenoides rupestris]
MLCPRILELACHKCSKTAWVTTPCEKLTWGNQEPIWPMCRSALTGLPSKRTQRLALPKRDLTAGGPSPDHTWREEGRSWRKAPPPRPSSKMTQAELISRLSAPRLRARSSEEQGTLYGHTPECDSTCPVWHIDLRIRNPKVSPRLLELSRPKTTHPDFQSNRQVGALNTQMLVHQVLEKGNLAGSGTSRAQSKSPRLDQLSLPRLKLSQVSRAARGLKRLLVSRGWRRPSSSPMGTYPRRNPNGDQDPDIPSDSPPPPHLLPTLHPPTPQPQAGHPIPGSDGVVMVMVLEVVEVMVMILEVVEVMVMVLEVVEVMVMVLEVVEVMVLEVMVVLLLCLKSCVL